MVRALAALVVAASLGVALCLVPRPAGAAPPTSEPDAKEKARLHFEAGAKLFAEHAYDAALAEFLLSRSLVATRGNTQNAALCLKNLGRFDEALDMFEALLGMSSLRPEDRPAIEGQIAELRKRVGSIEAAATESGVTIAVDGRERGASPLGAPVRVAAGTHVVRAYKDGFLPLERRVTVAGGERVHVDLALEPLARSGRLTVTEETSHTATVVVDNVAVGNAPWSGALAVGDHTVSLRGDGELGTQPATTRVALNQVTSLTLHLEALDAHLRVEPTPGGARVAIDGVVVGSGVWDGPLRTGRHDVEIGAEGFLPFKSVVILRAGGHDRVATSLDRDPESPIWGPRARARFVLEADAAASVAPLFGGGLSSGCEGGCSAGLPIGGRAVFHGTYQLPSGIGFGLDAGFVYVHRALDDRVDVLRPTGRPDLTGGAHDSISFGGPTLGASASLHRGDKWPLTIRLGAGALFAGAVDERRGSYGAAPESIEASTSEKQTAVSLFVAPEIRIGYRFAERWEASFGIETLVIFGLDALSFSHSAAGGSAVTKQGLAYYDDTEIVGRTMIVVAPGLGLRADF